MVDHPLALVTGATSGIGAAYAKRLAQEGFDLILQGRRQEKLKEFARNLEETYTIKTEVIIAELSKNDDIREIEDHIQKVELDTLINNAGYWTAGPFWDHDPDALEAMIRVHIIAPVRFIRAALPRMLERDKGDIINVSSLGAYFNMTTVENYGATKAYLLSLTESLHVALMGTGIRVQALAPGFTTTDFHSRIGLDVRNRNWMLPEDVVDISLKALKKGEVVCMPRVRYRFLVGIAHLLPRRVYYKVMNRMGRKIKSEWEDIEKKKEEK